MFRIILSIRRTVTCLLGAALLVLVGCASGGPKLFTPRTTYTTAEWSYQGEPGRVLTTEHFDIHSTLLDAELEQVLPRFLEAAYRRYEATQPPLRESTRRLQTYVFGTRREWLHYTQLRSPQRAPVYAKIHQGGYTEGDTSAQFYTTRSGLLATLAHEGWHQYSGARFAARMPAWLDEGLAAYHESFSFAGDEPEFKPLHNTFRINALRSAVQRGELFHLRELIVTHAGEVILNSQRSTTQTYYAQVWGLATFLRHGAHGRYAGQFKRMLHDAADGSLRARANAARLACDDPVGATYGEAVFYTYFGTDLEQLNTEYHNHIARVSGF